MSGPTEKSSVDLLIEFKVNGTATIGTCPTWSLKGGDRLTQVVFKTGFTVIMVVVMHMSCSLTSIPLLMCDN